MRVSATSILYKVKLANPFFGLATATIMLTACQFNAYHIKGEAKGCEDGEVLYIADGLTPDTPPIDSIIVTESHFIFHGETDTARLCRLYRGSNPCQFVTFFLEPGDIYVELSPHPGYSRVSGTSANNAWQALNDKTSACDRQLRRIMKDDRHDRSAQVKAVYTKMDRDIREAAVKNADNAMGRFVSTRYQY